MAEYIEREALMLQIDLHGTNKFGMLDEDIREFIKKQPAADVVEVKHGYWVKNAPNPEAMKSFHEMGIGKALTENSIYWTCSCCGKWGTPIHKYCSECGAKMDGDKNG